MASAYYDLDAILAEEELVPCTTHFDFSYLAHLDPDLVEHNNINDSSNNNQSTQANGKKKKQTHQQQTRHHLPENTKIKMPLWAVQKWATLGYVRISLPRHYARKARERLAADPTQVNLRKKNERYFLSGSKLVDLMEESAQKLTKALAAKSGGGTSGRGRNARQMQASLDNLRKEAAELQQTLIATYTGERLRQTLDWAWSSVGDDVTMYTEKLTEMERNLFSTGAMAALHHDEWKLFGHRRFQSSFVLASSSSASSTSYSYSSGGKSQQASSSGPFHDDDDSDMDERDDWENRRANGNRGNTTATAASNKRRRVR